MNINVPDRMAPPRSPGAKAVGITLAPGPGRLAALLVAGVPLLILVVIGVKTAPGSGGGSPSGYGGLPVTGISQSADGTALAGGGGGQTPASVQGVSYSPSAIYSTSEPTPSATDSLASTASAASAADSQDVVPTSPASFGTDTPSPTVSTTSASPAPTGPAATVVAAYDAINRHDYETAYALGLDVYGDPYATWVAGYDNTAHDDLTIAGVAGDVVTVTLTATNKDGSQQFFSGTYTVTGDRITGAHIEQTS